MADLHRCIDSTLNIVANELRYKADVVKDYGQLPQIRCMPFQLNQVFMNLLINAGQAIPKRGTISIRTGQAGNTVWVEIEDTGTGIAPDVQARIFEPFFTTKPVGMGTGLGLAVSFGIVQNHHGDIAVRSTEGVGTVFRVTLPIDPGSEQLKGS
jgi:signal transduction histidine kinase